MYIIAHLSWKENWPHVMSTPSLSSSSPQSSSSTCRLVFLLLVKSNKVQVLKLCLFCQNWRRRRALFSWWDELLPQKLANLNGRQNSSKLLLPSFPAPPVFSNKQYYHKQRHRRKSHIRTIAIASLDMTWQCDHKFIGVIPTFIEYKWCGRQKQEDTNSTKIVKSVEYKGHSKNSNQFQFFAMKSMKIQSRGCLFWQNFWLNRNR